MKKFLTITAVGLTLTAPASAVQKCVALDSSSTTCTSSYSSYVGKADWGATCTTNGTSVPIRGVAVCSNVVGSTTGAATDTLATVSSASDTTNANCWCKMVSPSVSSWVFFVANASAGYCASNCANSCAARAANFSDFRSALFSSLGD